MVPIIYYFTAILTGFLFSYANVWLLFRIDIPGTDPGAPAVMLVGFVCVCGILSLITAAIMSWAKAKHQREFPARISTVIFLLMFLPLHIVNTYFPDRHSNSLAILLLSMLVLSYVPLFHATAQALINVSRFFSRKKSAIES